MKNNVTHAELLDKMRRLRHYCDLSQEHIAAELDMKQAAYSKMERGFIALRIEHIDRFAQIFGLSFHEFASLSADELVRLHEERKKSSPPPRK
jgi:transcriptional regulator with XRE-family HTH domain